MYGCSKDCLILIPFRLPQVSCFPLSLKCFSSDSDNCSGVGIGPLLQFPHPPKGRSSPTNTIIFSPSFFVLQSFVWVYIFFSAGQVLLCTLSWYCACTSASEGVFLMYPWREMYSTSNYSSAILFLVLIFISYVFILSSILLIKSRTSSEFKYLEFTCKAPALLCSWASVESTSPTSFSRCDELDHACPLKKPD